MENMLDILKEKEIEVATSLINGGLTMAKSCMEQILQSPFDLEKIDYGKSDQVPNFTSEKGGTLHLVKTELKGQLSGSCFLIFSQEEVDRINKVCLPEDVLVDDSEESRMMKTAFLKEMDNMVAAAVVTEFSNILGLELFGDVPTATVMDSEKVDEFLASESSVFESIIHFKALFKGKELDISPDFIWMFSNQFVDKIKNLV